MKENPSASDIQETLNRAINFEHTALSVYSRAYFEFRRSAQMEDVAELLLLHSLSLSELVGVAANQGLALPTPNETSGPFARDPRQSIFGIEPKLAIDYLYASEAALSDFYQSATEKLPLSEGFNRRRDNVSDILDALAPDSRNVAAEAPKARWARCG